MTYSMKSALKPCPILGYTTRYHLLLDLDDTTYNKAARVVDLIFNTWPEVGDCLILISSKGSDDIRIKYDNFQRPYLKRDRLNLHLVFDNLIGYNKACKIISVLAGLHILNKGYDDIRRFRGDLTLRVSPKIQLGKYQDYPKVLVIKINFQKKRKDGYIKEYLSFLRAALSLGLCDLESKGGADDGPDGPDGRAQGGPVHSHVDRYTF